MMESAAFGTLGLDLGTKETFTKDDARPDDPGAAADRTNLRMSRLTATTGKPAARHATRSGDPDFSGAAAPRAGLRQFDVRFLDAEADQQFSKTLLIVREQVDPMQIRQPRVARRRAIQLDRDHEHIARRKRVQEIQRLPHFFLNMALLVNGMRRDQGKKMRRFGDRLRNGMLPVLAGDEIHVVDPWLRAVLLEIPVQPQRGCAIFTGVADERANGRPYSHEGSLSDASELQ